MIEGNQVLQALGDPTRRAIFDRLALGPASISQLAGPLGVTVTAVAQHVAVLEACGLARSHKLGRVRTCAMATAGLDVLAQWIETKRPPLERALDRLGDLLEE